jgi:probable F420-dependent oxidoreductase
VISPAELGRALEERGFESLFTAEHTHVPADLARDWAWEGGESPRYHRYQLDPFVALTAAAAVTERLTVGTGVTLLAQRDPIILAKEVATLDLFSGGRFVLGVGAGWNRQEAANHGVDPKHRFAVLREHLAALRTIWRSDVAEFHGEYVDFSPMYSYPKPVQRPHPPVILGGWNKNVFQRLVDLEVGWLLPPMWELAEAAEKIQLLRKFAAEQGRPAPPVTIFIDATDPATLATAAELEPARALFFLEPASRDDTLRQLDEWAVAVR